MVLLGHIAIAQEYISSDLIVKEAIGCGNAMTSNYSFGSNTFVFRENNIRIRFDDTSTPTSLYPNRDWSFNVNSQIPGANNFFSIFDADNKINSLYIESNAPSYTLFVEGITGNIGMGTPSPEANLHLKDNHKISILLDQDNRRGWGYYTWDIACDTSTFAINDVTNSKTPFAIAAGAPENSLVISNNGTVGIGTDKPEHALDVKGDVKASSLFIGNWKFNIQDNQLKIVNNSNETSGMTIGVKE